MRKPWIGANWKMHKDASQARSTATRLVELVQDATDDVDVVVFPSFPLIPAVAETVRGTGIAVGGQTLSEHEKGAYTGEVAGGMLLSLSCTEVLVGHSERRHVFGETNEVVRLKLHRALEWGLKPVLCVGETLEQREAGSTAEVVREQIDSAFDRVSGEDTARISVAYEPVWAIGTGKVATPQQAVEVHGMVRELLSGRFGAAYGAALRIHYGGSVKPDNVEDLIGEEEIDGALVGGASLEADSLAELVQKSRLVARR